MPAASDIHELYIDNGTHFNGSISYFSVPGKFLSQIDYQNGKETKAMYVKSHRKSITGVKPKTDGIKTNSGDGCIDWYWETYVDGVWVSEVYAYTTCDGDTPCALAVHIGGGNNISIKSDCSQSSGGGIPPSLETIVLNIKDDCLKAGWSALNNSEIRNKINDFLFEDLHMATPFRLTINQVPDIPLKEKDPPEKIYFGENLPPSYSNGVLDLTINLNYNTLQHGTEELVAAVIFHEVIHAYLTSQGIIFNNDIQHNNMLGGYQTMMLTALQMAFIFSSSNADFEALKWVGLEDLAPASQQDEIHSKIRQYTSVGKDSGKGTRCL